MEKLWDIINGSQFDQFYGKTVSVTGIVSNVNSNGTSFDLRTVDDITITVNLDTPLDDLLEGYVEVHGKVQGKNNLYATDYLQFTTQQTEDFDVKNHSELCVLLNSTQNIFDTQ